ncbi:MAG: hypothetical protein C5B50_02675 [Verrucomicrobia bacterium]|nr:MAG: hypothetical protein C5B50_02675 [Verrucomicrobiota bacterium]
MIKPTIEKYQDGSSVETLEDGTMILREGSLSNPMPLGERRPAPYNQPAPNLTKPEPHPIMGGTSAA